jgi:predicted dehydrogenase
VAIGNENGLRLRVYGDKGAVEWNGEFPNHLKVTEYGKPSAILTRGGFTLGTDSTRVTRMPAGLPEGYFECFANVYLDAAELIRSKLEGRSSDQAAKLVPTIDEGIEAAAFVEAVIASGRKGEWIDAGL